MCGIRQSGEQLQSGLSIFEKNKENKEKGRMVSRSEVDLLKSEEGASFPTCHCLLLDRRDRRAYISQRDRTMMLLRPQTSLNQGVRSPRAVHNADGARARRRQEKPEGRRWHGEKVDSRSLGQMIGQKCSQGLAGRFPRTRASIEPPFDCATAIPNLRSSHECGPRAAVQARRDPRCSRAGRERSATFCSALATRRAVAKCFGRS